MLALLIAQATLSLTEKKKMKGYPRMEEGGTTFQRELSAKFCSDGLLFELDQGGGLHCLGESVLAFHTLVTLKC